MSAERRMPLVQPAALAPEAPSLAGMSGVRIIGMAHHPADEIPGPFLATRPDICGVSMDRPRIMGILNVTPDSFSDGGDLDAPRAAAERAARMQADILDIGGESTRPGAAEVPVQTEIDRVVPAIAEIREAGIATPISVDTRKADVAAAALKAGANMINDVSAGRFDPEILSVAAEQRVPLCLMHSVATPETMQNDPRYDDVVAEVADHFEERIAAAMAAGVVRDRIVLDPGIGFGKTLQHNLMLLRSITLYHGFGLPLLVGASRKRFIGTLGKAEEAKDRMPGSVAVALHCAARAVQVLRVHDAAETRQALRLQMALDGFEEGA